MILLLYDLYNHFRTLSLCSGLLPRFSAPCVSVRGDCESVLLLFISNYPAEGGVCHTWVAGFRPGPLM